MRVLALHADVLVATSAIWQTNCVLVRGAAGSAAEAGALTVESGKGSLAGQHGGRVADETFVVDSPVLPEELDALPALLEQAGFPPPSGLLATHGDWDHLLGPLAFPHTPLGCAQSTVERLRAGRGAVQRELRAFDERYLIERSRPLALGAVQALPAPGRCEIGGLELELYPTAGHTADGMAILVPWARVLLVGDYLSPSEIPTIGEEAQALGAYVDTLGRLQPLVQSAELVVPGHGPPLGAADALTVLDQDLAYLRALAERGLDAELPRAARRAFQQGLHRENAARAGKASQQERRLPSPPRS
ncbi:MAG TPA: MBL fold metallo-hydrolase [Solirubrobacteraceae bacterium]|nr:MBL fold metallo-hydrolase [Solirubrobacteraceae bacterium]